MFATISTALQRGVVLLVMLLVATAAPVRAQGSHDDLARQVSEFEARVAGKTGPEGERAAGEAKRWVREVEESIQKPGGGGAPNVQTSIVSHQRGAEGIAFPSADLVVLEPLPSPSPSAAPTRLPGYWVTAGSRVAGGNQLSRPERCTKSGTVKVPRREKGDSSIVVFDHLYIPPDLKPLESEEVYGARVTVRVYGAESSEGVYLQMQADGVLCIPYRVRYTDTEAFFHQGEDALRNFDKDPSGPGVVHAWVKRKVAH